MCTEESTVSFTPRYSSTGISSFPSMSTCKCVHLRQIRVFTYLYTPLGVFVITKKGLLSRLYINIIVIKQYVDSWNGNSFISVFNFTLVSYSKKLLRSFLVLFNKFLNDLFISYSFLISFHRLHLNRKRWYKILLLKITFHTIIFIDKHIIS